MYELACSVIESAMELDRTQDYAEFAPFAVAKYLQVAAFSILKLNRSQIKDMLDESRGRSAYFAVIQFHKKMTVQANDVAARSTTILTQLWTSRAIFKGPNGMVDSLSLRCGSRLAMSVMFDSFWWWRQEFAGAPNPYEDKSTEGRWSRILEMTQLMNRESLVSVTHVGGGGLESQVGTGIDSDLWSWSDTFPELAWPSQEDLMFGSWPLQAPMSSQRNDMAFNSLPDIEMTTWM